MASSRHSVPKALDDSGRIKMLTLIAHGRPTYQALRSALNLSQQNLSHHVGYLQKAGLVSLRPDDSYRLNRRPLRQEIAKISRLLLSEQEASVLRLVSVRPTRSIIEQLATVGPASCATLSRKLQVTEKRVSRLTARLAIAGLVRRVAGQRWVLAPETAAHLLLALTNPIETRTRGKAPPPG